jgi:hypothetical protein
MPGQPADIPTTPIPNGGIFAVFRSQSEFISSLEHVEIVPSVLLVVCGVVYMLYGWKIFKALVILNALLLGLVLGSHLGGLLRRPDMPLYMAIGMGALLAMLAWPTMRYAVSIMGALAGSLLGYGIWQYVAHATDNPEMTRYGWAGALVGLVFLGLLAFVVFRVAVISWTSFQGAMMSVAGLVALLLKHHQFHANLQSALLGNVHLLPLLVGVPAGIGFIYQDAKMVKKTRKKKSSSGSSGSSSSGS